MRIALQECRGDPASAKEAHVLQIFFGLPWTRDSSRISWRKACAAAGITGLTFHDLRGTALTRLAVAGFNDAEIVMITGRSMKDVESILEQAICTGIPSWLKAPFKKLERSLETPNQPPLASLINFRKNAC